jgi:aminoglycoside/choline kinase family phosphotransferase
MDTFPYLAIQRNLQVLGAFSFLSMVKGKPFFEQFIPRACRTLYSQLKELGDKRLSGLFMIASMAMDALSKPQTKGP